MLGIQRADPEMKDVHFLGLPTNTEEQFVLKR